MSERPASLAEALVQLQARLPRITKDAPGQHGKYADLYAITNAAFPLLAELGLYWVCRPTMSNGQFVLAYALGHVTSGQAETGEYPLTSATPQAMGGQITYARRYAFCAVTGIAPAGEDDDGQAAEDDAREAAAAAWRPPAHPRTRKATRHRADRNGPLPDDDWTTRDEMPCTPAQQRDMGILFSQAGIISREDRLAASMSMLDLPELTTSKDLTCAQAEDLKGQLRELIAKEKGQ